MFFIQCLLRLSICGIWSGDHQAQLSELLATATHILLFFLWSILPASVCKSKWIWIFTFNFSRLFIYFLNIIVKNNSIYQTGWIETLLIFRCPQCPSTTNNRSLNDKHTHTHKTRVHTVNDPSAWHPNGPSWPSASQTGIKTDGRTCMVDLYCFQRHTDTRFSLFIQHTLPVFVHIRVLQTRPAINHTCLHPWRRVVSPFG